MKSFYVKSVEDVKKMKKIVFFCTKFVHLHRRYNAYI